LENPNGMQETLERHGGVEVLQCFLGRFLFILFLFFYESVMMSRKCLGMCFYEYFVLFINVFIFKREQNGEEKNVIK